jgi:hypothetical protein
MSTPNPGFARIKTVDEFASSKATFAPWDTPRARGRGFLRFAHAQKNCDNEIGVFCRWALADSEFPRDATTILRHLATRTVTSEILAAARKAVAAYRAWFNDSIEAEIREIEFTNPARAKEVRESLQESRKATERLFAADAQA